MNTKTKYLFIDRDGTLIEEPQDTFQIDKLEKLSFKPGVFHALRSIAKQNQYQLVIVSNQDGLGSDAYPLQDFNLVESKIQEAFANEEIYFADVLIDSSLPEDNSLNRKPAIGLLSSIIKAGFDIEDSYVIGDRLTDVELAKNLGIKAIFFNTQEIPSNLTDTVRLQTISWNTIYSFFQSPDRIIEYERKTNETQIKIRLNLDGEGIKNIHTGMPFFDHMLAQIATHASVDLEILCNGDLEIDEHHSIEDIGIALGNAIQLALSNKKGIQRYGFTLPMDDCEAKVLLDFGGRSFFKWKVNFLNPSIGGIASEMFEHFFKSFSDAAQCNLHIKAKGKNHHHKIEAIFKAFARSFRIAIQRSGNSNQIPSSKGIL